MLRLFTSFFLFFSFLFFSLNVFFFHLLRDFVRKFSGLLYVRIFKSLYVILTSCISVYQSLYPTRRLFSEPVRNLTGLYVNLTCTFLSLLVRRYFVYVNLGTIMYVRVRKFGPYGNLAEREA